MSWFNLVLFIFHHVFHYSYVLFMGSQLGEAIVAEFKAIEDNLGEIQWEDGTLKPAKYIECILACGRRCLTQS